MKICVSSSSSNTESVRTHSVRMNELERIAKTERLNYRTEHCRTCGAITKITVYDK